MDAAPQELPPLRDPAQDHAEAMAMATRLLGPRSEEHRERWRADLSRRAALVLAEGWEPYKHVWSSGEVVGVAGVLRDHDMLHEVGETLQTAWRRWSFDLFGPAEAQHDALDGYPRTRQWFTDTADLARQSQS
ncbi:hypothetical protein IUS38_24860 [Mycobacteroides abscessus subsp. abscessus]|uniref:hypothetical protein n=1 Tax=Mycobacteroides abscessus TaxID=36809 RepID=UPI0019D2B867|nr:hypothetical protein [Mycobacteroides abscessus]MBN7438817.1 hypothetical protein [Mycobacteroides abscessus subsp. abscessus]